MHALLREHRHMRLPLVAVGALLASRGPLSQKEVSDSVGIDPSDLVTIIDKMEHGKLLTRVRDEQDRRRYNLHLTDRGKRTFNNKRVRDFSEAFLAPLTSEERTQLIHLLKKLLQEPDQNS